MASTLYVETNFPVGYAKGQNPSSDKLLDFGVWPFRLAIPDVCIMESLSVLNSENKSRRDFIEKLKYQIREIDRDKTSANARSLQTHLEQARIAADAVRVDIANRLAICLHYLCSHPEHCEVFSIDPSVVRRSLWTELVEDPTDNLIIHGILDHAQSGGSGPRAFWSENYHDFEQPEATKSLAMVGVKYFRKAEAAVGWLAAQPNT